jgi:hypothetical protein
MPARMTLGEMAKALNRSVVYLNGLQRRFELPMLEGAAYAPAYLAFLRKLVHLRILGVPEDLLLDLWKTEKHLLTLLHFQTGRSPTWFLDECGKAGHANRRLLLTHHDMGPGFANRMLQPHLDFDPSASGLFSLKEAGDDVLRVLARYQELQDDIRRLAAAEAPMLRATLHWLPHLGSHPPAPGS